MSDTHQRLEEYRDDEGTTNAIVATLEKMDAAWYRDQVGRLLFAWCLDAGLQNTLEVPEALRGVLYPNAVDALLFERFGEEPDDLSLAEQVARADPSLTGLSRRQVTIAQQMAMAPMRVYQVSRVNQGKSVMLLDHLDSQRAPVLVTGRRVSTVASPGDFLAARVVDLATHKIIARGVWGIPLQSRAIITAHARSLVDAAPGQGAQEYEVPILGLTIGGPWLREILSDDLPNVVDEQGNPLVLIEDYHAIVDESRLRSWLSRRTGVREVGPQTWEIQLPGTLKAVASIKTVEGPQFHVFCTSREAAAAADRVMTPLFRAAIRRGQRTTDDPRTLTRSQLESKTRAAAHAQREVIETIGPETLTQVMQKMYEDSYEAWATTPLPMLDNRSPLDMVSTPQGAERVRAVIEMYEQNERGFAEQHKRKPASFAFLWASVGMKRKV